MRLLLQHSSRYEYAANVLFGPHVIRLRPAEHAKARIESYALVVQPTGELRWQQDPAGNRLARVTFPAGSEARALAIEVELAVEIRPVNPFDFFVDDGCKSLPFAYPEAVRRELLPYMQAAGEEAMAGTELASFLLGLPAAGDTVSAIVAMNAAVNRRLRYVIREEAGVYSPEETLRRGSASCRDSATLLVAALRSRGLAARFASGYLVQLADEGMIPDAPRGMGKDVVDLHAWAEVYLPGAGWIGLDATSGLLAGEGHIPLACAAMAASVAPIEGTSSGAPSATSFMMTVQRLGHEPRPTRPYEEPVWEALLAAGERTDARLEASKLTLTVGGEPTFNAREGADLPEWNGAALGPSKWKAGVTLAGELRRRLAPGAATLVRMGKHYPGEELPRWALEIVGRADGRAVWPDFAGKGEVSAGADDAKCFAEDVARRLGLSRGLAPAYEDPWRFIADEALLPVDVDPLTMDLSAPPLRQQLALVLDRGLNAPAGWVLPLARRDGQWASERWVLRRGHVFLVRGTSPMGLRLPLASLSPGEPIPDVIEEKVVPPDPRRAKEEKEEDPNAPGKPVRTALCFEIRDGVLHAFLPPLAKAEDFFALLAVLDAARAALGKELHLEGYPPPSHPGLLRMSVTPDPGVLEVNLPPARSSRAHAALVDTVFAAALHAGLHAEKYLLDGRQAGSGGGNHLTLGGPTPQTSPFLERPDLLASLLTFFQHHPSLSYAFTGLFVGPTSQAPRIDEARHDALYELEIALRHAFEKRREPPPPWLSDSLFRHLLVDVSGNTHRAEICIDKLFDPRSAHGRQGLVELRAFEMPPHPRMVVAQMALVRALVASFAEEPYDAKLVRWGQGLHDRFLLPYWLLDDLNDVLDHLAVRGFALPKEAYAPFVALRCPLAGTLHAGGVTLEVRNAIEPWHVLGEEPLATGTARYVDSSLERIEVRASGLDPERHQVLVNGLALPLRASRVEGTRVGGVRFRAWAPPHSLHPHLGIHHPVRFDVLDLWGRRSLGACAYHVWHPEGRGFDTPPLTRFEAEARRAQRFTIEGPMPWPVDVTPAREHPDAPYTLDLRQYPGDHPPPEPPPEAEPVT